MNQLERATGSIAAAAKHSHDEFHLIGKEASTRWEGGADLSMMPEAGALDPADETCREYERLVDPKYLDQIRTLAKEFSNKRLSLQSGVSRSAIMNFKKEKKLHQTAHPAKADTGYTRPPELSPQKGLSAHEARPGFMPTQIDFGWIIRNRGTSRGVHPKTETEIMVTVLNPLGLASPVVSRSVARLRFVPHYAAVATNLSESCSRRCSFVVVVHATALVRSIPPPGSVLPDTV